MVPAGPGAERGGDPEAAAAAAAALRDLGERLARGALPEGAVEVKRSAVRSVHRADVPALGVVYVKRDRGGGLAEWLRSLIRSPRARVERRNLERVRALGVRCPEPLWSSTRTERGRVVESVLVTRALEGARPLAAVLDAAAATEDEAARARAVAALCGAAESLRALHDAGLWHRDTQLGNVVVLGSGEPALIDLQKLMRLPFVPRALRVRDLAQMLDQPRPAERLAALRAYLEGPGPDARTVHRGAGAGAKPDAGCGSGEPGAKALDALAAAVERERLRQQRVRLASRAKRCVVASSGFRIDAVPGGRVYRRAEVPLEAALDAVAAHRALVAGAAPARPAAPGRAGGADAAPTSAPTAGGDPAAAGAGRVVKLGRSTCLTRQPWPEGGEVAVKSFPARSLWRALAHLVVRHRGLRAWRGAHALLVRGLATPEPLALIEERRAGLVVGSALVARWQAGAMDLPQLARDRFAGNGAAPSHPLAWRDEASVVAAFGDLVGRLHRAGLYHQDLKPANAIAWEDAGGRLRVGLIDLDALTALPLTRARRVKNLAQIEDFAHAFLPEVKRSHRPRFVKAYLAALAGLAAEAPGGAGSAGVVAAPAAAEGRQRARARAALRDLIEAVGPVVAARAAARARRRLGWSPEELARVRE